MKGFKVFVGDCIESMRSMPDQSVNCCVTSPPYFGLRDYGMKDQIGLEQTPEQFIVKLVEVFREVRRVLRDDGTLWVNIGDSYAGGGGGNYSKSAKQTAHGEHITNVRNRSDWLASAGLKAKDLIGIPWMLAFALRADGWYLRQDIIWNKPNPMPESVRDRCTKAHEYIFLLSKSDRYYFDSEAIKEPCSEDMQRRAAAGHTRGQGKIDRSRNDAATVRPKLITADGRNRRSVWTVATKPYKGAHFATFPPKLIEPCILDGCPVGGTVLDPFGGSGTTAGVALAHGRNAILCELNPEYASLVPARVDSILAGYGKTPKRLKAHKLEEAEGQSAIAFEAAP